MTNLVDLDRALAEFLEDGPNTAPEAPVIAALAHARTTPRRPDPLRRLRSDVMAAPSWRPFGLRPGLVLGVVALVAAGFGVAVIGSRPSQLPTVTPPSPTAPQSSETPGPSPADQTPIPPSDAPFAREITMLVSAGEPFLISVSDTTGELGDARSLQPGDGASVGRTDIVITADPSDASALIVTWQGTSCENGGSLRVDETGHLIEVGRQACAGDPLPLDRTVRLQFRAPVSAADWSGTFVEPSSSSGPGPSGSYQPLGAPAVPPIHVALLRDAGNPVSIDVVDESGLVVKAVSGAVPTTDPAREFEITNDSAKVLRLTWRGSPCDTVHRLTIDATATDFTIDRPSCGGDAIPALRSLVVTFSRPVDATTLRTSLIAGRGGVDMPTWTATGPDAAGKRFDITLVDPGYIVNTLSSGFDPTAASSGAGPTGIRLVANDENTFTLIWLGRACATTPSLEISPDGSRWLLIDKPCTTSSPDVLRMVDVALNLPRTTTPVPTIEMAVTVTP